MREFTVRLTHRPGMLAALAEELANAGINIEALAAYGMGEEGAARLIVDDSVTTRAVLQRAGFSFEEREILTTVLPDQPGELAKTARRLADAGVNIEAIYLLRSSAEGLEFAVSVDSAEPAHTRLAG